MNYFSRLSAILRRAILRDMRKEVWDEKMELALDHPLPYANPAVGIAALKKQLAYLRRRARYLKDADAQNLAILNRQLEHILLRLAEYQAQIEGRN